MSCDHSNAGRPRRPAFIFLQLSLAFAALVLTGLPVAAQAQWSSPQLSAALKDAAGGTREIKAFYRANGYRPLWVSGASLGPQAEAFLEIVRTARVDGLDPDDYRPRPLIDAIEDAREGSPRNLARAEMLFSRSFTDYVRDVRKVRSIGINYVDEEVLPRARSVRVTLSEAAASPSMQQHIAVMGWMNPAYAKLRAALEESWRGGAQAMVPPGATMRLGDFGYRVELLRSRMGLASRGTFDPQLEAAIRRFQRANGLPDDGLAGPRTLAAINGKNAGGNPDVLRLNLERARALPSPTDGRHIVVDAASARLWMYEGGRAVGSMKVIVGKPSEQTPMMAGLIRFASINPYWNIPPDLVRRRIAPQALAKGRDVLRGRYEVLSGWSADARTLDPDQVDWNAVARGTTELPVRQLPGGDNAMGQIKFMFPNKLGIYLHDTPEKELFDKSDRRFSSGCVRVEDWDRLARWLYRKPLTIPAQGREKQVPLPEPVPIHITYLTAAPEGGQIVYRNDTYNRDAIQLAQMGARRASR